MTFSQFKVSPKSNSPHYLLIGNPVSHSVSPLMHNTALKHYEIEVEYHAVAVSMSDIPSLLAHFNNDNFLGANITIPHKENFFDAVDELTVEAKDIGAINTIIKRDGKLIGHNTDAYGFKVPLDDYKEELKSPIADLKNLGGPYAGMITAGKFLENFTKSPYIHIDIAGPSFTHTKDSYRGQGGTGAGVRLLVEFLKGRAK